LQANKIDKTSIVNNDTTGGVDKVASAEVVKVHGQEIDTLTNNFTDKSNKKYNAKLKNINNRPYITFTEV
jgi:hypothetical protein